jgi:hypothetical protein
MDIEYYKEENMILGKKIVELEKELDELKLNTAKVMFKNKIKDFVNQIENNNVKDINKELFLYIYNIKNDLEKKIKDNIIIKLCNFILNDGELYHIYEPVLIIERLNKLINLIN